MTTDTKTSTLPKMPDDFIPRLRAASLDLKRSSPDLDTFGYEEAQAFFNYVTESKALFNQLREGLGRLLDEKVMRASGLNLPREYNHNLNNLKSSKNVYELRKYFLLTIDFPLEHYYSNISRKILASRTTAIGAKDNSNDPNFQNTGCLPFVGGFSTHSYSFAIHLRNNTHCLSRKTLSLITQFFYACYIKNGTDKQFHSFVEVDAAFLRADETEFRNIVTVHPQTNSHFETLAKIGFFMGNNYLLAASIHGLLNNDTGAFIDQTLAHICLMDLGTINTGIAVGMSIDIIFLGIIAWYAKQHYKSQETPSSSVGLPPTPASQTV